jgi:hypothetical protein
MKPHAGVSFSIKLAAILVISSAAHMKQHQKGTVS